jgi:FAD/FMN-containing dehydrogenase
MLIDGRSDAYAAATRPHTSSTIQRPARVAPIARPDDIAAALDDVAVLGRSTGRHLAVAPQATGHGAGAEVDDGVVLFDTSGLDAVSVDPRTRVATVGAGATWSAVNAAAEQHGLLGPAGSAPSVSVSG